MGDALARGRSLVGRNTLVPSERRAGRADCRADV